MKERFNRGFTLIEVMIVVTIVAIIATIAIPNYQDSVRKSKRAEAKEALLRVQMAQERWRIDNPAYATAAEIAPMPSLDNYTITTAPLDVPDDPDSHRKGFTVTATATGGQVNDKQGGVPCTPMTLTVAPAGDTRDPPECW